jgi:hypothetical protein
VSSSLNLKKETYQSEELRTDFQKADFRHGGRSVSGAIEGELSPKSYQWLMSAALRKVFTTPGADLTGLTLSVAARATAGVNLQVISGVTGVFASGIKVGGICRITAGTIAAGSQNRNLLIAAMTSTTISVIVLSPGIDGLSTLATEASKTGCTINFPGMRSFAPTTGHTDDSFAIEHLQSEMFLGCKVSQIDVDLPPSGMAKIKVSFMGKDMVTKTTTAYFTASVTAAPTTGVLAAANGAVAVGGAPVGLLTGLSFSIKSNSSAETVVGSNVTPGIFQGSIEVEGSFTVLLQDATFRDYFLNETEVSLCTALTTGSSDTADFLTFAFPRCKVGGADKSDDQKGKIMSMPFVALLPADGGNTTDHEQTTVWIQDSAAVTGV